jgi:PAS domain S-box-containing protein
LHEEPEVDRIWTEGRGLTDLLPVGILRTDARGECLDLNPQGSELLGIPVERALGTGWLGALEPDAVEGLVRRWSRRAAEEGLFEERLNVRLPDGTSRVASCRVIRVSAGEGGAGGFLAALLDVTEWQITGETLRRTTRELEGRVRELDCLFEISRAVERSAGSLPTILRDAVAILSRTWDDGGTACARIVLDGRTYQSDPFDPGPHTLKAEILVQGVRAGEIEVGFPAGTSPVDGEIPEADQRRLLEVVSQRLGRTAERVKGRLLLREKEEEMRERITHLTRVSTMGEMASSIAHEVNQPLTAIATYAQACRRLMEGGAAQPPRVMEVLQHISEEALRAGNIIHRLKDMVRRQDSRWTECDLNALIRDLDQLASVDARLHDVVLSFHLASELPSVLADGVQIQQVVLNLIRNGIDAVEEGGGGGGEVVVRTERVGPKAVGVSVEDNGSGLSPDQEKKLFQPFFTTKAGGMGMGLSISKSIATAHRGRISFSRNPSSGMTFHLTLPTFDER